eukprot:4184654-Amphidinium_carterae.1
MGSLSRQVSPVERVFTQKDGTMDENGAISLSTRLWETSLVMPPRQDATDVDARDVGTPDEWVKRNECMLRLTGRHPFNSEPPLYRLQAAGWITPPALHVVRNHGAVPQLNRETHEIKLKNFAMARANSFRVQDLTDGKFGPV